MQVISKAILGSVLLLFTMKANLFAQGQFAGAKTKALIGKKYNNDRVLPGLPDYEYRQVTLASDENASEQYAVGIFQKGPTYVVFFGINDDTTSDHYTILDIMVVKQVKKTQEVKALLCRNNKKSNAEIVAVTETGKKEFLPALRAWRFNHDKRRFEIMDSKGIDCMNEGD